MGHNCLSMREVRVVERFQEMERDGQALGAAHHAKCVLADWLIADPSDFTSAFAIIDGDRLY